MQVNSNNAVQTDSKLEQRTESGESRWRDRLARSVLLSTLAKIHVGHLVIYDEGREHHFGEDINSAEVVAQIYVRDIRAYKKVLLGGSIGSGEAYMLNDWWSPDLVQVIRIFVLNMSVLDTMDSKWSALKNMYFKVLHRIRDNDKVRSKKNISAHYDLGNDFYQLFLDPEMMYSSAIFPSASSTLNDASIYKLDQVCQKLKLQPQDHLLEIGSGWGGMAVYAAKHYGCKVTTVTISKEQYDYAVNRVESEGLQNKIHVEFQDYRDITGQYDKLVSIEMIEAVGHRYFDTFFSKCSSLLKDDGLMLIQAITIPDDRYEQEKNNADFIQTYIFPGGCLPSILALSNSVAKQGGLQLVGLQDIGLDYAKTLELWKLRFFERIDEVKAQGYDDVFIRMWDFYLSYCQGGFMERVIGTSQLVYAKSKCKVF